MSWHVAPSLLRLRSEINSRWPHRDKASDGTIGDASHSARSSDHNPNGRRSVDAIDIDDDGLSPAVVINAAKKHPSTHYIIYNRRIYSREYGFRARRYTGVDPHTNHLHISIIQTRTAENANKAWGIATASGGTIPAKPTTSYPTYPGLLKTGSSGTPVKTLQSRLNTRGYTPKLVVDGEYGPATVRNVKAFQKYAHVTQDGKVGPVTWKLLYTMKVT